MSFFSSSKTTRNHTQYISRVLISFVMQHLTWVYVTHTIPVKFLMCGGKRLHKASGNTNTCVFCIQVCTAHDLPRAVRKPPCHLSRVVTETIFAMHLSSPLGCQSGAWLPSSGPVAVVSHPSSAFRTMTNRQKAKPWRRIAMAPE